MGNNGRTPHKRMKHKVFSTMLLGAAVPVVTGEAAEFIPLGDLPGGQAYSLAIDLSADGSTVLGESIDDAGVRLFRWSLDTGFSLLPLYDSGAGIPNFYATSISGDGTAVGGSAFTGAQTEAVKWSVTGGFSLLGALTSENGINPYAQGIDMSADGNAMALSGTAPITPFTAALVWTSSMGLVPIGFLPEDQPEPFYSSFSFSQAISSDGQVVVGSSASTKHVDRGDQAFRWTMGEGMIGLGFLPGESQSTATAVSADGSVVVGMSGMTAFRWTEQEGLFAIGSFNPSAVSADGAVVVGTTLNFPSEAVIWTAAAGMRPLETYLQDELNINLPGWLGLTEAVGISDDGLVIAGNGVNASGFTEAFIAKLASPVLTTGAISFSGAVSFFLVDPESRRYGTNPETGEQLAEIPGLELSEENGANVASWLDIVDGSHLVYLTGTEAGSYALDFSFLHLDNESTGASFNSELLKGGVHVYSAAISKDTAQGAEYRLIYADTDGDGVGDASDSNPKSDLRPTIFIDDLDTGLPNRVLADGSSLNDIIIVEAAKATNHGEFVKAVAQITKLWTSTGLLSNEARSLVQSAAAQSDIP